MTCTDAQVRLMMRERQKGRTQEQAAAKANIKSRKTVARYERLGKVPSEVKKPRQYRTRTDPFADDWAEMEGMLSNAPELEAKTLFEWLCEQHPDKYHEGQLRTLQRRVADWRAVNQEKMAVLEQVHRPGEVLQSDGTWLNELEITIGGEPFNHILIHCVLPYSNWEWGVVAQSESLLAYRRGLQQTLFKLGGVPRYHQTDNASALTYQVRNNGAERAFNPDYVALLAHFGLEPRRIQVGSPEQNGDIESSNGSLKRALRQHLLLRGSREFATLAAYEQFIAGVMDQRNQRRQPRHAEEMAVMRPLTAQALPDYQEVRLKVNRAGLIRVQQNSYSVPTSLIGHQVTVRLYEWHLEVYYRQQQIETMARLVGQNKQQINYHHLIDSLLRKPGGFRNYRYREAMFPSRLFRQAWEQLNRWHTPRKADLTYLRILRLATRHPESEVATALSLLLADSDRWSDLDVEQLLRHRQLSVIPTVTPPVVNLSRYDQLLRGGSHDTP
jgi:hypothetical protein